MLCRAERKVGPTRSKKTGGFLKEMVWESTALLARWEAWYSRQVRSEDRDWGVGPWTSMMESIRWREEEDAAGAW